MLWREVHRNWTSVAAVLGSGCPGSLTTAIDQLIDIERNTVLGQETFTLIENLSASIATDIEQIKGLTSPEKQYYMEMVLNVGHDVSISPVSSTPPTTGTTPYKFAINSFNPYSASKTALPNALQDTNPVPSTLMNRTVTLSDSTGIYLATPVILNIDQDDLSQSLSVDLPVDSEYELQAVFSYTVGSIPISYTRSIVVNSTIPMADLINNRKVWVPGTLNREYISGTTKFCMEKGLVRARQNGIKYWFCSS